MTTLMSLYVARVSRPAFSGVCLGVLLVAAASARPAMGQLQYATSFTYDATTPPSQGSYQNSSENLVAGDPGVSAFFDYQSISTYTATATNFSIVNFSASINP